MRILIIKLSAIGDVVHSLPVLSALKRLYPDSRIHWLVEETAAGLLQDHPLLDRVLVCPRKNWIRGLKQGRISVLREFRDFYRMMRAEPYDLILDLQNLFKSAFWVAVARSPRKIGFSSTKELAYLPLNEKIGPEDFSLHAVDRYMEFVRYLGDYGEPLRFSVPVTPIHVARADQLLKEVGLKERKVVAVNPMALWPTKLWTPQSFSELADRLAKELGLGVVFTGGAQDWDSVEEIIARVSPSPVNFCGRMNLLELAALFSQCALVISTDTGPMHLAAAMGTPVVALFGPTAPDRTGPYGPGHVVVRTAIPCSPCFKKKCADPRCMYEITPDLVFHTVEKRLELFS
ncbi:MAG: lipopolysaccharide heptosyltransferase II [Deltaproteobacteria bacterium]|nr:lipopolysaccharide heptosyltransferase II [Deltaproteobacteria bacterium]